MPWSTHRGPQGPTPSPANPTPHRHRLEPREPGLASTCPSSARGAPALPLTCTHRAARPGPATTALSAPGRGGLEEENRIREGARGRSGFRGDSLGKETGTQERLDTRQESRRGARAVGAYSGSSWSFAEQASPASDPGSREGSAAPQRLRETQPWALLRPCAPQTYFSPRPGCRFPSPGRPSDGL